MPGPVMKAHRPAWGDREELRILEEKERHGVHVKGSDEASEGR